MKSKKTFEFIKKIQLDFDLQKNLGKLLLIDAN